MADNTPVDPVDDEYVTQDVDAVDLDEVEPEGPAVPGERENPLTLEAVHRQAFLNRAQSAFGDDPTVATPGEECEPQVSGPGDPDHVITLAKYGRAEGVEAEDAFGIAGGGLVAVDRETGEQVEGVAAFTPPEDQLEANAYGRPLAPGEDDDEAEDLDSLTKADLQSRLDDAGVEYASNANKAELVALVEENDA